MIRKLNYIEFIINDFLKRIKNLLISYKEIDIGIEVL